MTLRPLLPAAVALSALALTTAVYRLAPHPELPPPPLPEPGREPAESAIEALIVRSVARQLVARDVIAGRTTVPEAAALYRWLDAQPPRTKAPWGDQILAQAGWYDVGGFTDDEMQGVRVVAQVSILTRCGADLPPGCVERVRCEFLAARCAGSSPRRPRSPRTGARSCWGRPGPSLGGWLSADWAAEGCSRRSDTKLHGLVT